MTAALCPLQALLAAKQVLKAEAMLLAVGAPRADAPARGLAVQPPCRGLPSGRQGNNRPWPQVSLLESVALANDVQLSFSPFLRVRRTFSILGASICPIPSKVNRLFLLLLHSSRAQLRSVFDPRRFLADEQDRSRARLVQRFRRLVALDFEPSHLPTPDASPATYPTNEKL